MATVQPKICTTIVVFLNLQFGRAPLDLDDLISA